MSPYRLILASATMISRRVPVIVAIVAIIAGFAMNPRELFAQTTGSSSLTNTPDEDAATLAYWTADRLATAKAVPLPSSAVDLSSIQTAVGVPPASRISLPGSPPTLDAPTDDTLLFTPVSRESGSLQPESGAVEPEMFGGSGLRFTSSRLVFNAVAALNAEKKYPYATEGQLFFTVPPGTTVAPGNYVCSATVQRLGVIVEAGHCVSDGNGHFFKSWVFVPAERKGKAPFRKWTAHQEWVSNTWHLGGGGVPNAQDVSAIVLNKNNRRWIGQVTGDVGFSIPDLYSGQHVTVLGYPCNLDSCSIDHRTDAQTVDGGTNTEVIGADGTGGSSGGGWIVNYGEFAAGQPAAGANDPILNALVAVTSYGPIDTTQMYLGASILDSRYVECVPLNTCNPKPTAVLNSASVNNPGAC